MSKINHKELAISRLVTQFTESTNLINYIKTLLIEADTLEQVICDLLEKRWIDTAEGVNLDIIGAIVGQTREFIDAELFDYFGFFNHPNAKSFGSLSDSSVGGRFIAIGEVTEGIRILNDEEYRLFIRARIAKNSTSSTPENIIAQIKFIFNIGLVVFEDGDTEYTLSIGKILSPNEKSILLDTDIIPKTAGVRVNYKLEFDSSNFFAFAGIPFADGFGSVNDNTLGGKFATFFN